MISSLAAVLLVFGLLGALLFWTRRAAGGAVSGLSLSVVEAVNLGGGRSVTVVRSGERYFLLGATAHSISLIAELEPRDLAALKHRAGRAEGLPRMPSATALLKSLTSPR